MKAALTTAFLLVIFSEIAFPLPEIQNDTDIIVTNPPDTCVTPDGQIIQKNETIPAKIGECYGMRCNNELELEDELCGMASIEKGCHGRSYDFSLIYPVCCPAAVC